MRCVTFGEIMLRLNPAGYERLLQADSFEANYAGAEASVAVSLSCLGVDAAFVSKLPENEIAQAAINSLRRWGVDTRHILRGGNRIGIYFLEKGASQRPSKVVYDRAHSSVAEATRKEFDWDAIFADADWFHFSGITPALSDGLADACMDACKAAKARGLTVSLDPNYRAKLWSTERAAEVLQRYFPYVDLLIVNENQASELFGVRVPKTERNGDDITDAGYEALCAELKARFGIPQIALTERRTDSVDENRVCAKFYDGERLYASARYRVRIVDRLGAGDAFDAGMIYALMQGYSPQDAVSFAAAASCLNHSIEGDFNVLSPEEIKVLAKGNGSGRVQR